MKHKERLDVLLVARGLAETRSRAQAVIMAGEVYVNGQKADKAGMDVPAEDGLCLQRLRRIDGRIYRLSAPAGGQQGVCHRRGLWAAGVEDPV